VVFLDMDEVDWIEAAANYVKLNVGKDSYLLREGISTISKRLDPGRFVRIHRNCLVAREAIGGFERNAEESESGWAVVIRATGEKLPVSRRQHAIVKQFR
jgi:two-component system response regulator AlgR